MVYQWNKPCMRNIRSYLCLNFTKFHACFSTVLSFVDLLVRMCFLYLFSMEQSVSQATSVNHAAELDQILASYKVRFHAGIRRDLCRSHSLRVANSYFLIGWGC